MHGCSDGGDEVKIKKQKVSKIQKKFEMLDSYKEKKKQQRRGNKSKYLKDKISDKSNYIDNFSKRSEMQNFIRQDKNRQNNVIKA